MGRATLRARRGSSPWVSAADAKAAYSAATATPSVKEDGRCGENTADDEREKERIEQETWKVELQRALDELAVAWTSASTRCSSVGARFEAWRRLGVARGPPHAHPLEGGDGPAVVLSRHLMRSGAGFVLTPRCTRAECTSALFGPLRNVRPGHWRSLRPTLRRCGLVGEVAQPGIAGCAGCGNSSNRERHIDCGRE